MARQGSGRSMSFLRQLTLYSLLPVAVLGISIAVVGVVSQREITENLALQRNGALAQVAAAGVKETLNGYVRPLQTVAGALAPHSGSVVQQQLILRDWAPFLNRFEGGVALLDASGTAIACTPGHSERLSYNYSDQEYFTQLQSSWHPVFSSVHFTQPSAKYVTTIATPVIHSGEFVGALVGYFFLDRHYWEEDLGQISKSQGSQVYLIDGEGVFIRHADAAFVGVSVQRDEPLAGLVQGSRPASVLWQSRYLKEEAIAAYAPVPGVGWGLIVEEPWAVIQEPAAAYQWTVVGLMGLGLVFSLLVLFGGAQRVTEPIAALAREARLVASGAPFRPLAEDGPTEVRTLISMFNEMVTRLGEQQAALRHYATEMLQSQEEERRRLSRDLHDETVQSLVGLVQRIDLCRGLLERDPQQARRWLDDLGNLAGTTLSEVRRMSNDLRPLILEDLGLAAALHCLCDDLRDLMPQAHVHFELVGESRRLPPEVELAAFRVCQEALHNVRKHADGAKMVRATLYFQPESILLTVEDDGQGFERPDLPALVRDGHLGLAGMSERARLLGGEVSIASVPARGTCIALSLPLEAVGEEPVAAQPAGSASAHA